MGYLFTFSPAYICVEESIRTLFALYRIGIVAKINWLWLPVAVVVAVVVVVSVATMAWLTCTCDRGAARHGVYSNTVATVVVARGRTAAARQRAVHRMDELNHFRNGIQRRNTVNERNKLLELSVWATCYTCIDLCYYAGRFE